jgi:purine-binding chemotaxis protein CheW
MKAVTAEIVGNTPAGHSGAVTVAALDPQQYLTFVLGTETYAIGILQIKEIIEFAGLTGVPMMPACIRGVINLRGAVVPVLDLAVRFCRQPTAATRRTCIVIVELLFEGTTQNIGVIVDAVNEVLEIPAADIEPAPSFGARLRAEFIRGMGKVAGKFVIILDTDRVLSGADIVALNAPVTDRGESEADRLAA